MTMKYVLTLILAVLLVACGKNSSETSEATNSEEPIEFKNVSVHDPSIINDNGTYYIVGSHLAFAKSTDLVNWEQLADSVKKGNILFPDPYENLKDVFDWASTKTVWAGDMIKLKDGKYRYYFSACKGDQPLSVLGVATSDKVDGPYENVNIFLKSGGKLATQTPRVSYDATKDPNVVDPAVFYDAKGKLWMVYGSYSGGIFILQMNDETGLPIDGQGWGKKLLGGNHSRIEAPYIVYNKETDFYYLYLSYGGLDVTGGYNIRVVRSKSPDGPFVDAEGNDMIKCKGAPGSFFDDQTISKFGVKLAGTFTWDEDPLLAESGYISPGHNSAYYDKNTGKSFIIFHSRFPNRGEMHEVRVHELKYNSDGWPVIMPFRYTGTEKDEVIEKIKGEFNLVFHGKDISAELKAAVKVKFKNNGKLSGENIKGIWEIEEGNKLKIVINDKKYKGHIEKQWNEYENRTVTAFSILSEDGESIWAYQ